MDAQPPPDEEPKYDLEKVSGKQKKRISVLEKQLLEAMNHIAMLELEISEKNTEKKRSDYAIIISVASTFLDRLKKRPGKKTHLNKHMRLVFNALIWELWRDYLVRIVDGDDKLWDIIRMDRETDDFYDEAMAREFFQYVYDIYQKRIASGEITDLADDGTPSSSAASSAASSATSSPARVSPAAGRPFVQPPAYNMSTLFRFGINDITDEKDDEEEEDVEANPPAGAKGGAAKK
jgi:hypothetical protein